MVRSKKQIALDILKVLSTESPLGITRLTYRSNTNWKLLQPAISRLLELELIGRSKIGETRYEYYLTEKGLQVLYNNHITDSLLGEK